MGNILRWQRKEDGKVHVVLIVFTLTISVSLALYQLYQKMTY